MNAMQTRRAGIRRRLTMVFIAAVAAAATCSIAGPAAVVAGDDMQGAMTARGMKMDPLKDPARSEDDRERDRGFKPLEVYRFFGVEPGMTVADLWPGRGYNTHILSRLVGDEGTVLAVLGPIYYQTKYEKFVRPALEERIEAANLKNVKIVGPLSDLADDSVDVMITVRNYHDLGEAEDRIAVLPDLMRALKPGGILGVVDAYTPKEGRDEPVHRINEDLVIAEITGGGFELIGTSDILVNKEDSYGFDGREEDAPIHRYFIHRFVHKYGTPSE